MSRKQSIKRLLTSTEDKDTTKSHSSHVVPALVFGAVLGCSALAASLFAYTQGYEKGKEIAASSPVVAKGAEKVSYNPKDLDYLMELPPPYDEVEAQQNARKFY